MFEPDGARSATGSTFSSISRGTGFFRYARIDRRPLIASSTDIIG